MRRLAATDIPATLAASTCVLVFAICFFSLGSMTRYLASRALKRQTSVLARGLREAVAGTRHELEELPPIEALNCRNGTSDVLAQRAFENPYVRWIGLRQAGEMICRSGLVNRNPGPVAHVHVLDNVWSVELVDDSPGVVYVIQRRDDVEYIAIPETMLFDFESSIECLQCVTYQVDVTQPDFQVKLGDWNRVVLHQTEEAMVGRTRAKLTVGVLQRYIDQLQFEGLILAAGMSAIVALTFNFMLYGLLMRQTSMASLMRQGLRKNEFLPYYQPIVDGGDGSVLGAEALARWYRRGKMVPPGQFVPFAEENGLITPITEQIVKKVLKDLEHLGGWARIAISASMPNLIRS
jgi:hypothetical protein